MDYLIVSEMFGPTLQGEGRSQGQPAYFLRLGLCNLDCAWCDTPYTWDWTGKNGAIYSKDDLHKISIDDLLDSIPEDATRLVITGGEPLIQKKGLIELIRRLPGGIAVEIETNGTLSPSGIPPFVHFNVSPKLPHSGVPWDRAIIIDVLREFVDIEADFKFVVHYLVDLEQIHDLEGILEIPASRIWLMPEGRSSGTILRNLPEWFTIAAEHGWNLSTRLHVLAFEDKRGI